VFCGYFFARSVRIVLRNDSIDSPAADFDMERGSNTIGVRRPAGDVIAVQHVDMTGQRAQAFSTISTTSPHSGFENTRADARTE
jgi:hypothetical protein